MFGARSFSKSSPLAFGLIFFLFTSLFAGSPKKSGRGTGPSSSVGQQALSSQGGTLLRYKRSLHDVVTYKQSFYAERQIDPNRPEFFQFQIEWTVKVAVVDVKEGRYRLAIQYNRERVDLLNREELKGVLEPEKIFDAFLEQTDFEVENVRVVDVDERGINLNNSYYYNEMFSALHPLVTRIFALPEEPVFPGMTFEVQAEEPLTFTYKGVFPWLLGEVHVFEGKVAGGSIEASFFKESGLMERLEYFGEYLVNEKLVREHFLFSFIDRKNEGWEGMLADNQINKAVLLASLKKDSPSLPFPVLRTFLESPDKFRRRLGASYCARRGIPEGLNMIKFLHDEDPVVRFNAAKALAVHSFDLSALRVMAEDKNDLWQSRAANFLERSSYFVPDHLATEFSRVQAFIYGDSPEPPALESDLPELLILLNYMKPGKEWSGGFYKDFIRNPVSGRIQPYFVHLPVDYDPFEIYPLIVYFGGGDGRADQALTQVYQELLKSDGFAGTILFVPQAEGMWWEEASEKGFQEMLRRVLKNYNVDTNRMYAAGTSNGAMATFFYGTRLPDRFAAIFSNMGYPVVKNTPPETEKDREVLRNLRHTPVYLVHGDSDTMVFPVGSQRAYRQLRKLKYDVRYEELIGRNHDIKLSELKEAIVRHFKEKVRNPMPKQIEYVINDEELNWTYWVRVDKIKSLPAYVSAEMDESKGEIRIRTRDVESLTLFFDGLGLDYSREIKVFVNNRLVFQGNPQPSAVALLELVRERLDPALAYPTSIRIGVGP